MPLNPEFVTRVKKLLEFFQSSEGKLLLDSIEGYGTIALSAINPALGAGWSVVAALAELPINIAEGNNLDILQKFIEYGVGKRFGILGDLAIVKVKQLWHLTEIAKGQQAFSHFIKGHIFQKSYSSFLKNNHNTQAFSKYFAENLYPNIATYFREASNNYVESMRGSLFANINHQILTAKQMQDAINHMLSQQTIAGLNLNLGVRYQDLLSSDVLSKFNSYVDNTVKLGFDRFQRVATDDTISYIQFATGHHYVGPIDNKGLPNGQGMLFADDQQVVTNWKNGIQLNDPSTNSNNKIGGFMLPEIQMAAALVSIVSDLYGMKSEYEQSKHLESIAKVTQQILEQLKSIPLYFDKAAAQKAFDSSNAAIKLLAGIEDYTMRDEVATAFIQARLKAIESFDEVALHLPNDHDKLAFAPVLHIYAKNLVAIVILEYLFFQGERRKMMISSLLDVIKSLDTYYVDAPKHIKNRFKLIPPVIDFLIQPDYEFSRSIPKYAACNTPYKCVSLRFTYMFDDNIIRHGCSPFYIDCAKLNGKLSCVDTRKDIHDQEALTNGPLKAEFESYLRNPHQYQVGFRIIKPTPLSGDEIALVKDQFIKEATKIAESIVQEQQDKIIKEKAPILKELRTILHRAGNFIVEFCFQDILGRPSKSGPTSGNTEWWDHWTRYLIKHGYDSLRLEIATDQKDSRKKITEAFRKIHMREPNGDKGAEGWLKQLAQLGFHGLCLELAKSDESQNRIKRAFEYSSINIDYWIAQVSQRGFQAVFFEVHVQNANELLNNKFYSDAIKHYIKAVALNNASATTYYKLGLAYHKNNQLSDALKFLNLAIEIEKNSATYLHERGDVYLAKKDFVKAIDDYDYVINILGSKYSWSFHNRVIAKRALGQNHGNLVDLEKAVQLNSNAPEHLHFFGDLQREHNQFEQAIKSYDHSIKLAPDSNPWSYYNRGLAKENLGSSKNDVQLLNDALQDFVNAIKLSKDIQYYRSLGKLYLKLNKVQSALQIFKEALEFIVNLSEKERLEFQSYLSEARRMEEHLTVEINAKPEVHETIQNSRRKFETSNNGGWKLGSTTAHNLVAYPKKHSQTDYLRNNELIIYQSSYNNHNQSNYDVPDYGCWDNTIHQHSQTGESIFIYRVYKNEIEIGSASFYKHKVFCRSKDGGRHNIISTTGVFSKLNIDSKKTEDICEALPPLWVDSIISSAVQSAKDGALVGICNILKDILKTKNISPAIAQALQKIIYYTGYFLLRFHASIAQKENITQFDVLNSVYESAIKSGSIALLNMSLAIFKYISNALAQKSQQYKWSNTSKTFKFFNNYSHYGMFILSATQQDISTMATSIVTGTTVQKIVEYSGSILINS